MYSHFCVMLSVNKSKRERNKRDTLGGMGLRSARNDRHSFKLSEKILGDAALPKFMGSSTKVPASQEEENGRKDGKSL